MLGIVNEKNTGESSSNRKNKPDSLLKRVLVNNEGKLITFNDDGIYHEDEDIEIKVEFEVYSIDEKYYLFMRLYYPNDDIITGIPQIGHSASGKNIINGIKHFGGIIHFTSRRKKRRS